MGGQYFGRREKQDCPLTVKYVLCEWVTLPAVSLLRQLRIAKEGMGDEGRDRNDSSPYKVYIKKPCASSATPTCPNSWNKTFLYYIIVYLSVAFLTLCPFFTTASAHCNQDPIYVFPDTVRYMNVGNGNEAVHFHLWEYLFLFFRYSGKFGFCQCDFSLGTLSGCNLVKNPRTRDLSCGRQAYQLINQAIPHPLERWH